MNVDFSVPLDEFLNNLPETVANAKAALLAEGKGSLIEIKEYVRSVISELKMPLPLQSESYLAYIDDETTRDKLEFLDCTLPPGKINVAPVIANAHVLGSLANYINNSLGLGSEIKPVAAAWQQRAQDDTISDFLVDSELAKEVSKVLPNRDEKQIIVEPGQPLNPHRYQASQIAEVLSFQDICEKRSGLARVSPLQLSKESSTGENEDIFERQFGSVIKMRRMKKRAEREMRLENFFGMLRQQISPQLRLEFEALSLRGFASTKVRYRGAKKKFDLATAQSGFFAIGNVVNARSVDALHQSIRSGKRKNRTKNLIKQLLLMN